MSAHQHTIHSVHQQLSVSSLVTALCHLLHHRAIILSIAIVQAIIYVLLLPPWQHYDEPGHFEYAWLIANQDHMPSPGDNDPAMRRQVVASMQAHHFFWNQAPPEDGWWFNFTQLIHPPFYYILMSIPLRFAQALSIDTQLYIARSVSALFFVCTIVIAMESMRVLLHNAQNPLRWAVPITLSFLPPFVDNMTAINNDVGAIFFSALFVWGSIRIIRYGMEWRTGVWVVGAALFATATKNVAVFTIALVPVVFVIAVWVQRRWQWRWLLLIVAFVGLSGMASVISWGDAAYWYRWRGASEQRAYTRTATPTAPLGEYAIVLDGGSNVTQRRLINALTEDAITQLSGKTITLGAWVWATEPALIPAPGIVQGMRAGEAYDPITPPMNVTTTPTFVATTYTIPKGCQAVHVVFSAAPPAAATDNFRVFLDGAVLVVGAFPLDAVPQFDTPAALAGMWGGQPFTNLLRNGSGESAWLRLNDWVEALLLRVVNPGWGRTPSLLFSAFYDIERSSTLLQRYTGFMPLDGMIDRVAWGHVFIVDWVWVYGFRLLVVVSLLGSVIWLVRSHHAPASVYATLVVFLLAIMIVWGSTITRVLPKISEGVVYPVPRYTFSAIIPTMLLIVGGWWAWWRSPQQQCVALLALVGVALWLNVTAIIAINTFYKTVPVS